MLYTGRVTAFEIYEAGENTTVTRAALLQMIR
jgi:hypothetical protein